MRERAAVNKGGTAFMTPFADRKDCRGCFFMRRPAQWNYVADATCGPRGEQGEIIPCSIVWCAWQLMYVMSGIRYENHKRKDEADEQRIGKDL